MQFKRRACLTKPKKLMQKQMSRDVLMIEEESDPATQTAETRSNLDKSNAPTVSSSLSLESAKNSALGALLD